MTEPTYGTYLKEAFNASPRVPGLGNLPLNWLAIGGFATLGLLNPGFWLLGAGVEIAYLALVSHHPRFRSVVRGKLLARAAASKSRTVRAAEDERLSKVSGEARDRYHDLSARIAAALVDAGAESVTAEVASEGLTSLQRIFLDLLLTSERLSRQVDPDLRDRLQRELDAERRIIASFDEQDDPRVRRSREATAAILEKRIENLTAAARDLEYLRSELRRIEHQVGLIVEEATRADDPGRVSRRIDEVAATFSDTQEWMRLHRELLSEVDAEVAAPRPPTPQRTA